MISEAYMVSSRPKQKLYAKSIKERKMSQDPHSGNGDYPYGEQSNQNNPYGNNQASAQNPYGDPDNPYGASEFPYGGSQPGTTSAPELDGASDNPYGASEYPYGGSMLSADPTPGSAVDASEQVAFATDTNYNYGYNAGMPEGSPLPLGEAIRQLPQQYWRVLSKPSVATFAVEKGKASWDILWVQLLIYAIIEAIMGYLSTLINPSQIPLSMSKAGITPEAYHALIVGIAVGRIFLIPLFFFIGVGIIHLIAKAFKGQGSFLQYSYCILLFSCPLTILTNLFQLIPVAGPTLFIFAWLLTTVYGIVLYIFATMAAHRLSGGKASAVILIPFGVIVLLVCALFFLLVILTVGRTGLGG
jgi:hypothetical protein